MNARAGIDADTADLAELARRADGGAAPETGDTQSAPGGEGGAAPEGPPPGPDTAALIAGVLGALIEKAKGRFPSLATVWGPADLENFSRALAPLLDKYGLSPAWFEAWRVEIMALLVCGPLILATVIAIRADLDTERARAAKHAGDGSTRPAAAAPPGDDDGPVRPRSTGEI